MNLTKSRSDQVAEELLIVVAARPIEQMPLSGTPVPIPDELAVQLYMNASNQTARLDKIAQEKQSWTFAEQASAASRSLLTQDDPLPQTIYRVQLANGMAALKITLPVN